VPKVEIDSRTLYDFLISACASCGEREELLPEDRAWMDRSQAALLPELGAGSLASECLEFISELGPFVVAHTELKTPADLVRAVDKLTDEELRTTLLTELADSPEFGDLTKLALTGDEGAYHELTSQLLGHKGRSILSGSIAELAPAARAVLHAWLPRFSEVEDRVARILARDVSTRPLDEAGRDPIGFVEQATNGIRLVPERGVRRIVLAPSYFGRPYNSLTKVGDVQLICYPVADAAVGAASRTVPPSATVRLYRALGDETRLRILRLLADRDRYMTELANELELSKPTISHHLAQLRSAGLVTLTEQGNLTYYSLRRDRVSEAGPELSAFLAH
jgi:DNA-binding transcriptional ArsR family regulator